MDGWRDPPRLRRARPAAQRPAHRGTRTRWLPVVAEPEASALEAWLTVRAMAHERPKALFTLAAEQLHVGRIARRSVDQLVRLIGAARERAHQATFDALADQLTDRAMRGRLAFCAQTLVYRGDELIDLYASAVQNAERPLRRRRGARTDCRRAR